jgi:hypothetical protein
VLVTVALGDPKDGLATEVVVGTAIGWGRNPHGSNAPAAVATDTAITALAITASAALSLATFLPITGSLNPKPSTARAFSPR